MRSVIALAAVVHADRVLLVKQTYEQHAFWTLPGGRVEDGESVASAACREVEEETGLQVAVDALLMVRDRADQVIFAFAAHVRGGAVCQHDALGEIAAVRWFELSEIGSRDDVDEFTTIVAADRLGRRAAPDCLSARGTVGSARRLSALGRDMREVGASSATTRPTPSERGLLIHGRST